MPVTNPPHCHPPDKVLHIPRRPEYRLYCPCSEVCLQPCHCLHVQVIQVLSPPIVAKKWAMRSIGLARIGDLRACLRPCSDLECRFARLLALHSFRHDAHELPLVIADGEDIVLYSRLAGLDSIDLDFALP